MVKTACKPSVCRGGVAAIAAAAAAIVSGFGAAPARAATFGNAPWCAVRSLGSGNVEWDCQYMSAEECAPTVIAGNRGFCNLNPYYPGTYSASPPGPWRTAHHRHKRGARHRTRAVR